MITGPLLKQKAKGFALQIDASSSFKASNGWLDCFRRRHGIQLRSAAMMEDRVEDRVVSDTSHDGSISVPELPHGSTSSPTLFTNLGLGLSPIPLSHEELPTSLPALSCESPSSTSSWYADPSLRNLLKEYTVKNIFVAYDLGFYFRALPEEMALFCSSRITPTTTAYEEDPSNQLSLVFGCNGLGELVPPLVVGTEEFSTTQAACPALDSLLRYAQNPKAWVTSDVFHQWVLTLDRKMQSQERRILLIVPNKPFFFLPMSETLAGPESSPSSGSLRNVQLKTMSYEMTLEQHPFYPHIHQHFKSSFRHYLLQYVYMSSKARMSRQSNPNSSEEQLLSSSVIPSRLLFDVRDIPMTEVLYWIAQSFYSTPTWMIQDCFDFKSGTLDEEEDYHPLLGISKPESPEEMASQKEVWEAFFQSYIRADFDTDPPSHTTTGSLVYASTPNYPEGSSHGMYAMFDDGVATCVQYDGEDWEEQLFERITHLHPTLAEESSSSTTSTNQTHPNLHHDEASRMTQSDVWRALHQIRQYTALHQVPCTESLVQSTFQFQQWCISQEAGAPATDKN